MLFIFMSFQLIIILTERKGTEEEFLNYVTSIKEEKNILFTDEKEIHLKMVWTFSRNS